MYDIEYIKNNISLIKVIEELGVIVKKNKCLCPFHNEKTPSFVIFNDKTYYCFGCGAKGDVINFIQEYYNYVFYDAVQYLTEKYNLEYSLNEDELYYQKLYKLMDTAVFYFKKQLNNNTDIMNYLINKRMFTKEIINKYNIGFIDSDINRFKQYIISKGYTIQMLRDVGLLWVNHNTEGMYFTNRIIIPIYDNLNKVIGFGGRTIIDDKSEAKYINTTNTKIYKKSNTLFGINHIKSKVNNIYIAEGYFDVLALNQLGYNSVGLLGTNITKSQIKKIKNKINNELIIFTDNDKAGYESISDILKICLDMDINTKICKIDDIKDPADILISNKNYDLYQYTVEPVKYIMNEIKNYNSDIMVKKGLEIIYKYQNTIYYDLLINELSIMTGLDKETILNMNIKKKNDKSKKITYINNSDAFFIAAVIIDENIKNSYIDRKCELYMNSQEAKNIWKFLRKNKSNFTLNLIDKLSISDSFKNDIVNMLDLINKNNIYNEFKYKMEYLRLKYKKNYISNKIKLGDISYIEQVDDVLNDLKNIKYKLLELGVL